MPPSHAPSWPFCGATTLRHEEYENDATHWPEVYVPSSHVLFDASRYPSSHVGEHCAPWSMPPEHAPSWPFCGGTTLRHEEYDPESGEDPDVGVLDPESGEGPLSLKQAPVPV